MKNQAFLITVVLVITTILVSGCTSQSSSVSKSDLKLDITPTHTPPKSTVVLEYSSGRTNPPNNPPTEKSSPIMSPLETQVMTTPTTAVPIYNAGDIVSSGGGYYAVVNKYDTNKAAYVFNDVSLDAKGEWHYKSNNNNEMLISDFEHLYSIKRGNTQFNQILPLNSVSESSYSQSAASNTYVAPSSYSSKSYTSNPSYSTLNDDEAFIRSASDITQMANSLDAISYYAYNLDIDGVASAATILKSSASKKLGEVMYLQVSPRLQLAKNNYESGLTEIVEGANDAILADKYFKQGQISQAGDLLQSGGNHLTLGGRYLDDAANSL
jgi:hypothetical protein